MKAAELHKMTDIELVEKLASYKKEQFNLRWQTASHQNQNPKRAREVRRNIARINTIMNDRNRKEAK